MEACREEVWHGVQGDRGDDGAGGRLVLQREPVSPVAQHRPAPVARMCADDDALHERRYVTPGIAPTRTRAREQVDLRAESLEAGLQQQVLLEAVASPMLGDKLPLQIVNSEGYRDTAVRIEVLERDRVTWAR